MSREYLHFMYDSKGGRKGNSLNNSIWATLAEGFEGAEFGQTPLDSILIGASRVGIPLSIADSLLTRLSRADSVV